MQRFLKFPILSPLLDSLSGGPELQIFLAFLLHSDLGSAQSIRPASTS